MSQPLINITKRQSLIFASFLVLYQFLTYIANDMIMPGMIHVIQSFNGPESAIATSLTAYILGGASLQLILGPISDRIGRRPVMLFGVLLFFICTLFIAFSNSINQFLVARFFEGMGLCFIGVVGYATLQEIFAEMDAVRLIAVLSNIASLAPLLGPLAGATFILYFNWRGIFFTIAFFALIAFIGLLRVMPESVGTKKHDGSIIQRQALTFKTVMHNYGNLITNGSYLLGAFASGLINVPCIAWIAISPIILVTGAKLTVVQYALWQLPIFGSGIIGNWYLRHLTKTQSLRKIIHNGSFIFSIGLIILYGLPLIAGNDFYWLMPGLILYGFSLGVISAPLNRLTLYTTPVSKGTAYAMMSLFAMIIQALGVEIANHIYASHNNLHFALYCLVVGIVYMGLITCLFAIVPHRVHTDNTTGASAT